MHVSASSGSASLRLAEVRIGAIHIGVPVDCVLQAIPVPAAPTMLPRREGALRGVVEHNGALVPVVDLARWVDLGTATGEQLDARRILILRALGRTIGLEVDAVGGLVDVLADRMTRLHHDDNLDEVFHTVVTSPSTGHILSLLDVSRLTVLAAAWNGLGGGTDTHAAFAAPAGTTAQAGQDRRYALLQVGQACLGVPVGNLAQIIPMPALESLGGSVGTGHCQWAGRHVAVLDPGVVVPDRGDTQPAGLLAVLEHDGLMLGLPVHKALELRSFDGTALAATRDLTATVFDRDGAAVQLLDSARLFERFPEAALSRGSAGPGRAGVGATEPGHHTNSCAWIVFEADGLAATPIDMVERVQSLSSSPMASGTMEWRGAAVPVVDLRRDPTSTQGHVIIVRAVDQRVGYVVQCVDLLIPPRTGRLYSMGVGGNSVTFITTGEGSGQRSYREFRLGERCRA